MAFLLDKEWKRLCDIHELTKHYTLIAEELNYNMNLFPQPMKEQRDGYEHIIRAYAKYLENGMDDSVLAYMKSNLGKALSHEYRAVFDTLDYLTLSLRERVQRELNGFTLAEICSVYPQYPELRKQYNSLPAEFAKYREAKDIGGEQIVQLASSYGAAVQKLVEMTNIIIDDICPRLAAPPRGNRSIP